jgi:hypothetical protein
MKKLLGALVGALVLALAPQVAGAQALTVEEVGAAFAEAGYQVAAPTRWTWLSPPLATLLVQDPTGGSVVLALVYVDAFTAREHTGVPRLVPGFGPASRHENVAVVRASRAELQRWFEAESRRSVGMLLAADPPVSTSQVGPEVLDALYAAGRGSDPGRGQHGATPNADQPDHRT